MKKFQFSLDTVLSYKQQILDVLQGEYARIQGEVRTQETRLELLWEDYRRYAGEYRERCAQGITAMEIMGYQSALRGREHELQRETQVLDQLKKKEEDKRAEVVSAKQDTSSIEKLREKKLDSYNAAIAKSEEQRIEEFVSSRRSAAMVQFV